MSPTLSDIETWLAPTWHSKRWSPADIANIIYWRLYGQPKRTQAQLGKEYAVTATRISQLETLAFRRLSQEPSRTLCLAAVDQTDPLRRILRYYDWRSELVLGRADGGGWQWAMY